MLIWRNDKSLNFFEVLKVQTSMVPPKNDIFSEKMRCGKIFQCPPKFLKLEYENNFKNANVEFFPQLDESIVWFLGKMKLPNFFFKISRTFYYHIYILPLPPCFQHSTAVLEPCSSTARSAGTWKVNTLVNTNFHFVFLTCYIMGENRNLITFF